MCVYIYIYMCMRIYIYIHIYSLPRVGNERNDSLQGITNQRMSEELPMAMPYHA